MSETNQSGQCQGVRRDGQACQSPATNGQFCFWHDPQRPASEKHAAAQRGGLSHRRIALPASIPPAQLASPEETLALLTAIAQAVQRGEVSTKTATSIGYLADIGRKIWEACIAARKLDRVEKLVRGRGRR